MDYEGEEEGEEGKKKNYLDLYHDYLFLSSFSNQTKKPIERISEVSGERESSEYE
jgi:hypothetical protein